MEILDIVLIALEIILSLLLIPAAKLSKKYASSKWRIAFALPAVICSAVAGFGGFEKLMLPAYIGAVITLAGFFGTSEKLRISTASAAAVLGFSAFALCAGCPDSYRARSFTKEFDEIFPVMKNHYVLAEQKGIDWDELYGKYRPQFAEADKAHSKAMNYAVWCRFVYEFHDGHVGYIDTTAMTKDDEAALMSEVFDLMGAGDYGLSLMGSINGGAYAVNVESSGAAADAGIHNGTVITSWNGMSIYRAGSENPFEGITGMFADKDNEEFFISLRASIYGGDSVTVTYLDDNGSEKTARLPRIGNGYARYMETYENVCKGVDAANFGWQEIDEDTVCFRLKSMQFDTESAKHENYDSMKYEVIAKLDEYKAAGKKNLVIDMRNNGGGSGELVKALGSIFAPEGTHYYATDGYWDENTHSYARDPETGAYLKGGDCYFVGEDRWEGRPIIILVNSNSTSAADHFTMIMRGFDNVTVMGFTESNGSAQGIGTAASGKSMLSFSECLLLDRDGNVFIDSGSDYESGNDIDIRVPFDENAVRALFDEDRDHVMDMALEEFKRMNG